MRRIIACGYKGSTACIGLPWRGTQVAGRTFPRLRTGPAFLFVKQLGKCLNGQLQVMNNSLQCSSVVSQKFADELSPSADGRSVSRRIAHGLPAGRQASAVGPWITLTPFPPLPLWRERGEGGKRASIPQGSRPGLRYFAPPGLRYNAPIPEDLCHESLGQDTSLPFWLASICLIFSLSFL